MREPRYWLAVGPPDNWRVAFARGNIWGVGVGRIQEVFWDLLNEEDILILYVTRPISGVVGFGTIRTKFKDTEHPLWPIEVKRNKVLYPLRFEFSPEKVLPSDSWPANKLAVPALKDLVRASFQPLRPAVAKPILEQLAPGWRPSAPEISASRPALEQGSVEQLSHDQIRDMLVEIGRIQKFLAEAEYNMDAGRLDAVWRRVEKSVPTYVFEIQVGGDIYHALAKLKHAYDLWNSHIFLVARSDDWPKYEQLLAGTFHEIRHRIRFLPLDKVHELFMRKRSFKELESSLGIPT